MKIIKPTEPTPPAASAPPAPVVPPVSAPTSLPKAPEIPPEVQALAKEAKALESSLQDELTARLVAARQTLQELLGRISSTEVPPGPGAPTAIDAKRMTELLEAHRKKVESLESSFQEEQKRLQQALQQRDKEVKTMSQVMADTQKAMADLQARPTPAPVTPPAPVSSPAPTPMAPVASKVAAAVPVPMPAPTPALAPKPALNPPPMPSNTEATPSFDEPEPFIPFDLPPPPRKIGFWNRLMDYLNGTAVEIPIKKKGK